MNAPFAARPAVELQAGDLTPAGGTFCPNPKAAMRLWNSHPKIYLDVSHGPAQCPYCATVYRLKDAAAAQPQRH
ncbi:MAG: zinc-finger domain-containing protein [Burkholderiaceae bacterium]|jgi:uncharacterized Zn-finger protein|nr:zinc-finger domain-containing protein [Burkholderiaceae bacterium]